jgi:GMC oxidoreductase
MLAQARARGSTIFHPSGTCMMAPSANPMAVVDHELRVHGVSGLRVADLDHADRGLGQHQRRKSRPCARGWLVHRGVQKIHAICALVRLDPRNPGMQRHDLVNLLSAPVH